MPSKPVTFKTSIDIESKTRSAMIALCNQQLADAFDLFSQVKQAHWNVKGEEFIALHKFYDELAEELEGEVDMIAERATALGGLVTGTVRMAASASRLPEFPLKTTSCRATVEALVERYAHYAASSRTAIDIADKAGDKSTADLFTEVSRAADKSLWFLEAHIQC